MKYKEYFISDSKGNSNCIIRSFCKILNKEYDTVFNELINLSKDLNCSSFTDVEVFEKYLSNNSFKSIDYGKDLKIKDLELDNDSYIIFCWDKKDYYHMIPIIENTIYDKSSNSLELYVINTYKKYS